MPLLFCSVEKNKGGIENGLCCDGSAQSLCKSGSHFAKPSFLLEKQWMEICLTFQKFASNSLDNQRENTVIVLKWEDNIELLLPLFLTHKSYIAVNIGHCRHFNQQLMLSFVSVRTLLNIKLRFE